MLAGFLPSSSMGTLPVPMLNSRPKPGPSVHLSSGLSSSSYGHLGSLHTGHHSSSTHMANSTHPVHSLSQPSSNLPSRVSQPPHQPPPPPPPHITDPRQPRDRPLPPPVANSPMVGPATGGQQPQQLLRGGAQRGNIPSLMSLPSFPTKPFSNSEFSCQHSCGVFSSP